MIRRPPRSTRTYTLFPYTTLFLFDLVETNPFNATAISQADYHLQHLVRELNAEGARIAREGCDAAGEKTPGKPRFVIGVLGPTSRTASISPDVNDPGFRNTSFDQLRETYREAAEGLIEIGRAHV